MIVHNIVDISPLYHRFAYATRYNSKSDIPVMYLVMREVERMRTEIENRGADVITSACFDSPGSFRKKLISDETSELYKSGRSSILTDDDFKDIETMKEVLSDSGVNVFCKHGCEADDLMAKLASYYNNDFEMTVLYTTDKDMMANIRGKIGMRRYINGIWRSVSQSNFVDEAEVMFKTKIPFNAIGLYLSTVGDSADKISGIHKFGSKAFEKAVFSMNDKIDWESMYDYDNVAKALVAMYENDVITVSQLNEAASAYNIVRNIEISEEERDDATIEDMGYGMKKIITGIKLPSTLKVSSMDSRIKAYTNVGMPSLAK